MNPEHVEISSVKITIAGKEIELTISQIRALWKELDDLVGPKPSPAVYIPVPQPYPVYTWPTYAPIYVNPNVEPFPDHWYTTIGPLCTCNTLAINVQ